MTGLVLLTPTVSMSPNNVNINQNFKYIKIRSDIVDKHNNIDSTGSRLDVILTLPIVSD